MAGALNGSASMNPMRELLWIGGGKDDFLLQRNEEFVASLKEKDIRHE